MTECSEKRIELPVNDAATCWYLSINLALFHKERRELNAYFTKDEKNVKEENKLGEPIKGNFQQIYNHYKGTTPIKKEDLLGFRTIDEMKAKFNTSSSSFDIAGSKYQDASEYILKLFNYISLEPLFGVIVPQYNKIYDIWVNNTFRGQIQEKATDSGKISKVYYNNNKNTETLIFFFNRSNQQSLTLPLTFEIEVLKEIIVPLRTDDKNIQIRDENDPSLQNPTAHIFKLDAIVAVKPGHYFAYVNCTGTEEWLKYDAMSGGTLKDKPTFASFEKMMKEEPIQTQATLLFTVK